MYILDYFLKWEARTPDAVFLRQPNGDTWTNYTWQQVGAEARQITRALQIEGLSPGDRIALLSANCARWPASVESIFSSATPDWR
jgi:long-chain acyl-CoA synthetase